MMGRIKEIFSKYWWLIAGMALLAAILFLTIPASQTTPPMITPVLTLEKSPAALSPDAELTQIAIHATPTPIPTATPWDIATPTSQEPTATMVKPRIINPLTGLRVADSEILQRQPVLVKLANWPRSLRPFNQIINADLVFEYYNGHQTNHLLALFYTNDATAVGPLAPGRLIDARLARHYQADLVVASADDMVTGVFENTLADRVFYRGYAPCPGICTETAAQGGNTVVDTAAIRAFALENRPPLTAVQMEEQYFAPNFNDWDEIATRFSYMYADFSVMDWRYDPESGKYQLWQEVEDENGVLSLAQSFDRDSGEPIAFDNVIFLMANYIEYNSTTYDINMREGDPNQVAILLRNGKLTYGTWYSESLSDPFQFYVGGDPYPLKPGRSWITFATTISRPEATVEGEWDLVFRLR